MRCNRLVALVCTLAFGGAATAETPWRQSLDCDGGGYWPVRVPVEVKNANDAALTGAPVQVRLSKTSGVEVLIGLPVAGLRAVDAVGDELLYDIRDAAGEPKRTGNLTAGDRITFPAVAPAKGTGAVYLYAGNVAAWPVMDWWTTGLANAGFEKGDAAPEHWEISRVDATHRMSLVHGGARSGGACARCDVQPGATSEWVAYVQNGILVAPGQRYRFTAWVKGKDVKGEAGWYVHVDGARPLMVNCGANWDGSFDWRRAVIEFIVPEGGETLECGTVLHGTGTAWYDDAALEVVENAGSIQTKVLPAETMRLQTTGADTPWPSDNAWTWRAPLRLRNFTDHPVENALSVCDIRAFRNGLAKILGFKVAPALMLTDPDAPGQPLPICEPTVGDLTIRTAIPPKTEKTLWLYAAGKAPVSGGDKTASPTELVNTPLNLLVNGDMEQGGDKGPLGWISGKEGGPEDHSFEARRVKGGVNGTWCLELEVPKATGEPGWVGWRQMVPVKPLTTYILSGYVKTKALDGDVTIFGHVVRADGSTIDALNFAGTPLLTGDKDWTRVEATVTTPSDCASLEIDLTTNHHGTVWHDAVMLAETHVGLAGVIEARAKPRDQQVWPVNPLVKVFQEDLPPLTPTPREINAYAARNTWEPFEVAVRAPADANQTVSASALRGPNGAVLEPPDVYRVGYVPIDFPVGYHFTSAPAYKRFLPATRGNDGWPGWWPDPLEAIAVAPSRSGTQASVSLKADKTQALWFDVHVPSSAAPGTYTGEVSVGQISVPVTLTVWDFTVPDEKHLPALYDLRHGPLGDFLAGPDRKEKLRDWQRFLARFSVSPSLLVHDPVFTYDKGRVTMETHDFDEEAKYLLDVLHVAKVYTPQLFYACGWAYPPKDVFGLKPFTPEYVAAWKDAYRLFVEHVTQKGWRNRFVFYIADEPFAKSDPTISGLARLADMGREVARDIPIYSSTWTDIKGLEGHLTQWGIGVHGSFPLDRIEARRAAGDRFWFTVDGHMCTDTPLLAIERLLFWFCFRYGVDGYEFWGVSWWSYNPWQCGWHQYISQSDEGKKYYHVRYPNGDGFLAYPPREPQMGPAPSIRLMAARAGVYDYEIFLALRRYADGGNPDARAALDAVRALTPAIPNQGGRFSTLLMPDPDAVQAARITAGETLVTLSKDEGKKGKK